MSAATGSALLMKPSKETVGRGRSPSAPSAGDGRGTRPATAACAGRGTRPACPPSVEWHRLGELIERVDRRNTDKRDLRVLGLNKDKVFMPTAANMEGVDTSKYKIIEKGDFVFSGMQTGRDVCIRIGLYTEDQPALVSPAYETFRLKTDRPNGHAGRVTLPDAAVAGRHALPDGESVCVLPEYFFMFFNRTESDRLGWFLSDSSVRSNLDWPRFEEIQIPVPTIDEQRKVVEAWQGLRKMKEDNERLAEPLMALCRSYMEEAKKKWPMVELGEYISERNERNKEYEFDADDLQGVACSQNFIKSIATTNGMDFGYHKIVRTGDYAYSNRINVGSIACRTDGDCIVSPSYTVFYITRKDELVPEFLSIWFARKEFLRATLFFAHGTIKDDFSYDNMCRVKIPLPPMEVQKAVVDLYRCANEAKAIAAEADKASRAICPALIQKVVRE